MIQEALSFCGFKSYLFQSSFVFEAYATITLCHTTLLDLNFKYHQKQILL